MEKEITGEMLLSRNIREIPTLLDPLLPKSGLVCLAGSSDTGRFPSCRSGASMYRQSLRGLRFMFDCENVVAELEERLSAHPADLVVVDCFSDLYMGSMNEGNQVRQFLMQYSQLANKHKCLVIFLHHCGKRTEMFMPSKHNLLGSQAFEAKMRLVLELRSDISDVTYKHLCCVKGNYLSAEYKSESIKLHFSEHLTFKETGERVTFENLLPVDTSKEAKYQLARQLKEEGQTYEQIAKKLGYKDKSSVTKLIQSYENKKQKQNG